MSYRCKSTHPYKVFLFTFPPMPFDIGCICVKNVMVRKWETGRILREAASSNFNIGDRHFYICRCRQRNKGIWWPRTFFGRFEADEIQLKQLPQICYIWCGLKWNELFELRLVMFISDSNPHQSAYIRYPDSSQIETAFFSRSQNRHKKEKWNHFLLGYCIAKCSQPNHWHQIESEWVSLCILQDLMLLFPLLEPTAYIMKKSVIFSYRRVLACILRFI